MPRCSARCARYLEQSPHTEPPRTAQPTAEQAERTVHEASERALSVEDIEAPDGAEVEGGGISFDTSSFCGLMPAGCTSVGS